MYFELLLLPYVITKLRRNKIHKNFEMVLRSISQNIISLCPLLDDRQEKEYKTDLI